jgi:ABC-type uncharacterized transport system permease subunit
MTDKLKSKHVVLGLAVILLCLFIISFIKKDNLEKNQVFATAKIYKFGIIGRGNRIMDEKVAFYEYFVKNEKYFSHTAIYPETKVGLCFEIKYSSENPNNHEIIEKRSYFECQ